MTPKLTERQIQRANMELIVALGFQAMHIGNGAHLSGDGLARAKQMSALKKDGLRVGAPDLVVIGHGGRVGFMEIKTATGKLDPAQVWWRDEFARRGVSWAMVNTPDGARTALREWGWIK